MWKMNKVDANHSLQLQKNKKQKKKRKKEKKKKLIKNQNFYYPYQNLENNNIYY